MSDECARVDPVADFGLGAEAGPYEPEFFLYHAYGPVPRASFSSAADAMIWQRGNAGQYAADMFFFVNRAGERVRFETPRGSTSHAHAVLDVLDGHA